MNRIHLIVHFSNYRITKKVNSAITCPYYCKNGQNEMKRWFGKRIFECLLSIWKRINGIDDFQFVLKHQIVGNKHEYRDYSFVEFKLV